MRVSICGLDPARPARCTRAMMAARRLVSEEPARDAVDDVVRGLLELAGEPDGLERGLVAVGRLLRAERLHFRARSESGLIVEEVLCGPTLLAEDATLGTEDGERAQVFIDAASGMTRFTLTRSVALAQDGGSALLAIARGYQLSSEERALLGRLVPQLVVVWRTSRLARTNRQTGVVRVLLADMTRWPSG